MEAAIARSQPPLALVQQGGESSEAAALSLPNTDHPAMRLLLLLWPSLSASLSPRQSWAAKLGSRGCKEAAPGGSPRTQLCLALAQQGEKAQRQQPSWPPSNENAVAAAALSPHLPLPPPPLSAIGSQAGQRRLQGDSPRTHWLTLAQAARGASSRQPSPCILSSSACVLPRPYSPTFHSTITFVVFATHHEPLQTSMVPIIPYNNSIP